jgi:hypothetical protein
LPSLYINWYQSFFSIDSGWISISGVAFRVATGLDR